MFGIPLLLSKVYVICPLQCQAMCFTSLTGLSPTRAIFYFRTTYCFLTVLTHTKPDTMGMHVCLASIWHWNSALSCGSNPLGRGPSGYASHEGRKAHLSNYYVTQVAISGLCLLSYPQMQCARVSELTRSSGIGLPTQGRSRMRMRSRWQPPESLGRVPSEDVTDGTGRMEPGLGQIHGTISTMI